MAQGRKILYFLGAGASYGAGAYATVQGGGRLPVPTQRTFWSTFLRFCKSKKHRQEIEAFLFRYFLGYHRTPARLRPSARGRRLDGVDVEEVFTFLSERISAPSTSSQLRSYTQGVWDALLTEIAPVFAQFAPNRNTRRVFRGMLGNHVRGHDAIISFNYDTIFEDSLPGSQRWAYEVIEDTTNSLRILKPHGSVNWAAGDVIHRVSNPTRSVIVAPTHLKFIPAQEQEEGNISRSGYLDQSPQIQEVWTRLEQHMRGAKALVFIGYSFPDADLYFSSLLRSVVASRAASPTLVLVNPDAVPIAEKLSRRFSARSFVRYFDLNQFIGSSRERMLEQIRNQETI